MPREPLASYPEYVRVSGGVHPGRFWEAARPSDPGKRGLPPTDAEDLEANKSLVYSFLRRVEDAEVDLFRVKEFADSYRQRSSQASTITPPNLLAILGVGDRPRAVYYTACEAITTASGRSFVVVFGLSLTGPARGHLWVSSIVRLPEGFDAHAAPAARSRTIQID